MSWNPLFSELVTSSILHHGPTVVATWALFVASADRYGEASLTVPYVAAIMGVPIEEIEKAFEVLSSPDPHSRSSEHEGRRIVKMDNGHYYLPTHAIYRKRAAKTSAAERTQRWRERRRETEEPREEPDQRRDEPQVRRICSREGCSEPAVATFMGMRVCSKHCFPEDNPPEEVTP